MNSCPKKKKERKKKPFINYCVNNTISLLVIILYSIIQRNVWLSGSTEKLHIDKGVRAIDAQVQVHFLI